jgi:hypothetical protein
MLICPRRVSDKRQRGQASDGWPNATKVHDNKFQSDSLPELSDPELESEEWSLSTSRLVAVGGMPVAFVSKSAIRCSSCRIFSASTSSSMLFRFSPPVPVPFPRLLLVGGARVGLITKLYSFVSTDAGKESISSSISSLLCLDEGLRFRYASIGECSHP